MTKRTIKITSIVLTVFLIFVMSVFTVNKKVNSEICPNCNSNNIITNEFLNRGSTTVEARCNDCNYRLYSLDYSLYQTMKQN